MKACPAAKTKSITTADLRVSWVDYARGICIIFVVMMHSTDDVHHHFAGTSWMDQVIQFARPFRMPDFFLLSGLFMGKVVGRDWRTFLDRRVLHFVYFYYLWFLIQFLAKLPAHLNEEGGWGTAMLFLRSVTFDPYGTLWFIWILPLFGLTVRLTKSVPAWVMIAVGVGLEAAPIDTGLVLVDEFAARFVYYYIGYSLAGLVFSFAAGLRQHLVWAVVGVALWALGNGWAVGQGYATLPGWSFVLGILGAMAVITAAVMAEKGRVELLRFMGEHWIVIYLSFFLPMKATRTVLDRSGWIQDLGTISALVTLAGVAVPFLMWWVSRKVGLTFLFERPAWAQWGSETTGNKLDK